MSAFTYLDNDIKLQYLDLVCTDKDTSFLNKYLELPEIKRLAGITQFCGGDYTNIHDSILAHFTRLDHSLIVAKMTYHFTGSKTQAITALYHDVLTPAFAHANDFRKGDTLRQESSETNEYKTFVPTKNLSEYLREDKLTLENILNIRKYTVLENKKPKLCTDRLDGVIHTNLIWRPYWNINDVAHIYI
jgi:HD superfamily phosphohydrolase